MSSPLFMPLLRRVSLFCGATVFAASFASAQSLPSPNPSIALVNESSSSAFPLLTDSDPSGAGALSAAASAAEGSGGAGGGQYGSGKHGVLSFSHLAFEAGGGFNGPVGNDTSNGGVSASSTSTSNSYGGPFLTWGGNFTVGGGLHFSKRISLLAEYQFLDDKLPGAFINAVGTQGGHAHIWSLTLDPVIDLFPKQKNSLYVTGGGGFYRKVTSFTDPEEEEECYYFCGVVVENATVYHFSSNQGGANFGVGFTHRLGGSYDDSRTKLFAEARYLFVDTPSINSTNGTGTTGLIPVTFGLRW